MGESPLIDMGKLRKETCKVDIVDEGSEETVEVGYQDRVSRYDIVVGYKDDEVPDGKIKTLTDECHTADSRLDITKDKIQETIDKAIESGVGDVSILTVKVDEVVRIRSWYK